MGCLPIPSHNSVCSILLPQPGVNSVPKDGPLATGRDTGAAEVFPNTPPASLIAGLKGLAVTVLQPGRAQAP